MNCSKEMDKIFAERKNICKNCRASRISGADKYNNTYSNLLGGFGTIKKKVDVFIVLESHGGGGRYHKDWIADDDIELEESNRKLKEYYIGGVNLKTFHQKEIRNLCKKLDNKGFSWYATDLVKCYVKKGGDNWNTAVDTCFKKYLKRQIDLLTPKVILLLGGTAIRALHEWAQIEEDTSLNEVHGTQRKVNACFDTFFVYSVFPSAMTADHWTECGEWKKPLRTIKNILGKGR